MSLTFLDATIQALRSAAAYNSNDMVAPLALFWPDEAKDWEAIIPRLREKVPILALGTFDTVRLTGPAIWIRCMLARRLDQANWAKGVTPVVYLPGYSRASLRAVEECAEELKPLAGLQYLGVIWSQRNGRDWTLSAFLQSQAGGLGIPVAPDAQTSRALRRAARALLEEPLDHLRACAPLRSDFFNALLTPDITKQVLLWMNDPDGEQARLTPEEWEAFADQCRRELGFDPMRDGEVTAARKLGEGAGRWTQVWGRFKEAPANYSSVPDLLRRAKPQGNGRNLKLFESSSCESWPQDNEFEEDLLRAGLLQVSVKSLAEACPEIVLLEEHHRHRRNWVWAKLGRSPLALALGHLSELSKLVANPPYGGTVAEIANRYCAEGWKADLAALQALSAIHESEDVEAVSRVLRVLYLPWLRDLCESFQSAWESSPPKFEKRDLEPENGVVFLFVDALRMDLAYELKSVMEDDGLSCDLAYRLAPLPSITETAKPAASPVARRLSGGPELAPTTGEGTQVDAQVLRSILTESGFAALAQDETGDPEGAAWTECGRLDEIGHVEGRYLAYRAHEELRQVSTRVRALADAGWRKVQVITDHGWLLVPGGLPSYGLPEPATETRKGRAARLKPGAAVDCMTMPWFWDPSVSIAVAPGVKCFAAGREYEHGGLSPQEVVVPELTVTSPTPAHAVRFEELRWVGLRCKIVLSGAFQGLLADLRTKPADPGSTLSEEPKQVGADGTVSLLCPNDSCEGSAAVAVVYALDRPDRVLAQYPTVVGGGGGGDG